MRRPQQYIQRNWEDDDRDYYNDFDEDIKSNKGDYIMNIEWDYSYYQPWSDNEWLVDEMIAMQEETLMAQNEDITMQ